MTLVLQTLVVPYPDMTITNSEIAKRLHTGERAKRNFRIDARKAIRYLGNEHARLMAIQLQEEEYRQPPVNG